MKMNSLRPVAGLYVPNEAQPVTVKRKNKLKAIDFRRVTNTLLCSNKITFLKIITFFIFRLRPKV